MKQIILFLLCIPVLLFACTGYEKENQRLTEEIKMVRDENSYLKAEIVGLQKQVEALNAKMKEEEEGLQRSLEEERDRIQKKSREERQAVLKRSSDTTKKKNEAGRKDPKG
jgi:hypothetical protein